MNKELKNIRKLVGFMRKQGVLKLKQDGIEIELSSSALFPEQGQEDPPDIKETTMNYEDFERIALYSAPQ